MPRARRLRIICTMLALLCGIMALVRFAEAVLPVSDPAWLVTNIQCERTNCRLVVDPLSFIGPVREIEARDIPGIEAAIMERISQPRPKMLIIAAEWVRALPVLALYISLGFAMLRFGDAERFNVSAINWLRRGAITAAIIAVTKPVAESLQTTAIMPVISGDEGFRFSIMGSDLPFDLFLAGILWVATWALQEGRQVHEELSEYV